MKQLAETVENDLHDVGQNSKAQAKMIYTRFSERDLQDVIGAQTPPWEKIASQELARRVVQKLSKEGKTAEI
jgi:hypothetical protein